MSQTTTDTTAPEQLEELLAAAEVAAPAVRRAPREDRARWLEAAADALDAAADELVPVGMRETNLPEGRLRGELVRTTFQLRLFAEVVRDGRYLDVRIDHADAEWPMGAPRPDLRRMLVALGPVLVFSASNFPFAFSVAGGDTASALAAGCPVIVKAHHGHLELSRRTARILHESLRSAGAPEGVFALIVGTESGRVAIQDPRIAAAGFTGSIPGGRALFDLAQQRPVPIPFYGELGSNNPVVVTPAADAARGPDIAKELVGSFTLGAGQFCTKPGTVLVPAGSRLLAALGEAELPGGALLLNERIHSGYLKAVEDLQKAGARVLSQGEDPRGEAPSPILHVASGAEVLANPEGYLAECFGPSTLVIEYADEAEMLALARAYDGQLTASIQGEDGDEVDALVEVLAERAGRLLWNQWPTGVSVTYAQQHGGPYPASTASGSTSVGTAAIERFLRPVAFQGFPSHALPDALRDEPAEETPRMVDGR